MVENVIEIKEKVMEILEDYVPYEIDESVISKNLKDLSIDSVSFVFIKKEIEHSFNIKIIINEIKNIDSVGGLINHISREISKK